MWVATRIAKSQKMTVLDLRVSENEGFGVFLGAQKKFLVTAQKIDDGDPYFLLHQWRDLPKRFIVTASDFV